MSAVSDQGLAGLSAIRDTLSAGAGCTDLATTAGVSGVELFARSRRLPVGGRALRGLQCRLANASCAPSREIQ